MGETLTVELPSEKVTSELETAATAAVDTFRDSFVELVEFAKSVGPDIWHILVRQQTTEAICGTIGLALAMVAVLLSITIIRKRPKWAIDSDNQNHVGWLSAVMSLIGLVGTTFNFLVNSLPRFINPAYYALMDLKP